MRNIRILSMNIQAQDWSAAGPRSDAEWRTKGIVKALDSANFAFDEHPDVESVKTRYISLLDHYSVEIPHAVSSYCVNKRGWSNPEFQISCNHKNAQLILHTLSLIYLMVNAEKQNGSYCSRSKIESKFNYTANSFLRRTETPNNPRPTRNIA